jgi:hypothetical protein
MEVRFIARGARFCAVAVTTGLMEPSPTDGVLLSKENQMADNKDPNAKQPGEHPEGEYHYNPGNQAGKAAKVVPKEEAGENDEPHHERSTP